MFNRAIIIGTGKLPSACACLLKKYNIRVEIYEYSEYIYSQLELLCKNKGLDYRKTGKNELTDFLQEINEPLLIISANNTYIFPKEVVKKENLLIVNFHPALLPKHMGRNAEAWSIYSGDVETGVSWHLVDEKIDHGQILYQKKIPIDDKMTSLQLMSRQLAMALEGFEQIVDVLVYNELEKSIYQHDYNICTVHYAKDIPNCGQLDATWSMEQISRFLRAMDYGKLQVLGKPFMEIEGEKYVWDRYQITSNELCLKNEPNKGIFADSNLCIQLMKFRKEESDEGKTL